MKIIVFSKNEDPILFFEDFSCRRLIWRYIQSLRYLNKYLKFLNDGFVFFFLQKKFTVYFIKKKKQLNIFQNKKFF